MNRNRLTTGSFLALIPLIYLLLFYFYPLKAIFKISLFSKDVFQPDPLKHILMNPYYLKIIGFTITQAAISTLITLVVALPGAFLFARYNFYGKTWFNALATVPFVMPTVVLAAAFQALLGSKGILSIIFNTLSRFLPGDVALFSFELNHSLIYVFLAHLFYNYAIILRIVGTFYSNLDTKSAQAARTLGASRFKVFFHITLPLISPAIIASALLVFIFCFSSFGVILILGGPSVSTIETQIYRESLHLFNLPAAATLSLIQILFTLVLAVVYTRIQKKIRMTLKPTAQIRSQKRAETIREKLFLCLNLGFILIFFILPMAALFIRSFLTPKGLSFDYYKALFINASDSFFFVSPMTTIFVSLIIAVLTVIFSLILGISAAFYLSLKDTKVACILNPLFLIPLSTSAVTLGLGFIIALSGPYLNLRSSFFIFPIAHTLVAFPFVIRIILPTIKSIPENIREAAKTLGANPFHLFRLIDIPLLKKSILVGAVFSFTISLGEFGASSFIARPNLPTLSVSIFRYLGQPGDMNYGRAMAMSALLMIITLLGFFVIERCKGNDLREF